MRKIEPRQIMPHEVVRLTRQGKYRAEVLHMAHEPRMTIKRIDKDRYMVVSTGEICEYEHNDTKQIQGIKRAMAELRGIACANFYGEPNERHITLTYQDNMTDPQKLYLDFAAFYKRLKRHYPSHSFEYIAVAEPQERGAWHMHILLKTDQSDLFLEYGRSKDPRNIRNMWREVIKGGGNVDVQEIKLKDGQNDVGVYFVAYFTDIIPEDVEARGDREEMSKARQKGQRLHLYPKGMRFYRCSKGIIKPEKEIAFYSDVESEYGKPMYQVALQVMDKLEINKVVQEIQKQTHRKKS